MNMEISNNLDEIGKTLPPGVKLIAVSKHKPVECIEEAYQFGQRVFGESIVKDLVSKYEALPKDIEWHMIGHLQTNKVKSIVPFVSLIHAVDSLKLLQVIHREASEAGRVVPCLLQFRIAEEETKYGLSEQEAVALLESEEYGKMDYIRIAGVMGIATNTPDDRQIREEFRNLHRIFKFLKDKYFAGNPAFKELSIGMSGDYLIAVEEGSTMVRIGSSIFGERDYAVKI